MVTVDANNINNSGSKSIKTLPSTTTTSDLISSHSSPSHHHQQQQPSTQNQGINQSSTQRHTVVAMASVSSSRSGSSGDEGNVSNNFVDAESNNLDTDRHAVDADVSNTASILSVPVTEAFITSLGANFKILPPTDPVRELQTIIRDKNTSRSDFVFYADRLIRLIVEEGLNKLPYEEKTVITPTGASYSGLKYLKGNCGVSIVRSGEAMEQGLRDCCRSIRIGKILVQKDEDTHEARVVYTKFPEDIASRKVLLMYPIMSSGNTVIKAVKILRVHGVKDQNIIILNLFCTPIAAKVVTDTFPDLSILTSEVNPIAPTHFGTKYFGTD